MIGTRSDCDGVGQEACYVEMTEDRLVSVEFEE